VAFKQLDLRAGHLFEDTEPGSNPVSLRDYSYGGTQEKNIQIASRYAAESRQGEIYGAQRMPKLRRIEAATSRL
jgi:hypothetical protein